MDLEKAYDTIDRQMLRLYGVGGKLLKAVQSFYQDSRACVRVGNDESEWFPVNVGLRQAYVVSMVVEFFFFKNEFLLISQSNSESP